MTVIAVLVELVDLSIVISPELSVVCIPVMRLGVSFRLLNHVFFLCMKNWFLNLFEIKQLNHLIVELN